MERNLNLKYYNFFKLSESCNACLIIGAPDHFGTIIDHILTSYGQKEQKSWFQEFVAINIFR